MRCRIKSNLRRLNIPRAGFATTYLDSRESNSLVTRTHKAKKMPLHQDVEFKTVDGTTLRGQIYLGADNGGGIVLTPGVSSNPEATRHLCH